MKLMPGGGSGTVPGAEGEASALDLFAKFDVCVVAACHRALPAEKPWPSVDRDSTQRTCTFRTVELLTGMNGIDFAARHGKITGLQQHIGR